MKTNRIYNTIVRKKLVENLNKITDNIVLLEIYNIIIEDIGNNYSSNKNGVFVNLNILSDICIKKLINICDKNKINNSLKINNNDNIINYKLDEVDLITEMGHKLTNHEKVFIKKLKKNN
jgi:hypothetical protein